jgi:hypothetical protein
LEVVEEALPLGQLALAVAEGQAQSCGAWCPPVHQLSSGLEVVAPVMAANLGTQLFLLTEEQVPLSLTTGLVVLEVLALREQGEDIQTPLVQM